MAIYTLRTFTIRPEHFDEFARLSSEEIWPYWWKHLGSETIGMWKTLIGDHFEVQVLHRYRDFTHWELSRTHINRHPPESDEDRELWERYVAGRAKRFGLSEASSVKVLEELPGSPHARGVLDDGSFAVDESQSDYWTDAE